MKNTTCYFHRWNLLQNAHVLCPITTDLQHVKEEAFLEYLLSNCTLSPQFIMSGIGFDTDDFRKITSKKMNIISLENDKYHLLQEEDYLLYSNLMNELCDAEMK